MKIPCCPHCGLLTLQGRVRGATAYACEQCKGHYVDGASLSEFLNRHGDVRAFERILQRARDAQLSRRDLKCPDCGTASYHELHSEAVLLDACATCGGLYLDKGEANVYLDRARVRLTPDRVVDRTLDATRSLDVTVDLFDLFF